MGDYEAFRREFDATGSVIVPGVLDPAYIAAAKHDLEAAIATRDPTAHVTNLIAKAIDQALHFV